jgi:hypothetical protein
MTEDITFSQSEDEQRQAWIDSKRDEYEQRTDYSLDELCECGRYGPGWPAHLKTDHDLRLRAYLEGIDDE